jgi:biopolymer transport protein ExbD
MRIARGEENGDVGPNVTPLLDMMFILVIFLLVTSRFQQEERDAAIRLAKTSAPLAIATVSDVLVINVDKDGRKIVDGRERELPDLESIVKERVEKHRDAEVVIRADVRAKVADLQAATEVCHRLGVKTPNISYEAAAR